MDANNPKTVSPELQAQTGSTSDTVLPQDAITALPKCPPTQCWTPSGYPIVDNKYHDLETDEIKTHSGPFMGGPPSISIYWQNRLCTGRSDQFKLLVISACRACTLSEYIIRIGDLLRKGACKVDSMNVTRYDVYMVVNSELSQEEFREALLECGLL